MRGALALAVLLVPLGFLAHKATSDPDNYFLGSGAHWIQFRLPSSLGLRTGKHFAPKAVFECDFEAGEIEPTATLEVCALSRCRVRLNGEELEPRIPAASWRETEVFEVGHLLRPGANRLRIQVSCAGGPPSLRVRGRGLPPEVSSGREWTAGPPGGPFRPASGARDAFPQPYEGEEVGPMAATRRSLPLLLALFGASILLYLLRGPLIERLPGVLKSPPNLATIIACAAWLLLFVNNLLAEPDLVGPDVGGHRAYLRFLLEERRIPTASDGWSTYHPPLFYLLSALGQRLSGGAILGLKLVPFLAGLGQILLARWAVEGIFRGRPTAQVLGVTFAAAIPMNVYVAHFFTNEGLAGFLTGFALCQGLHMLTRDPADIRGHVRLGVLCGLALMTKYSGLIALVVVAVVLGAERVRRGERLLRVLLALGIVVALATGVAGWVYGRNLLLEGTAFPGNWELDWWQDPGFLTTDYFTRFGGFLSNPFKVGLNSFFDSLYATFWGDAMLSGAGTPGGGASWNRDQVAVVLLLGLPSIPLLAAGGARALLAVLRDGDAAWSLVLLSSLGLYGLVLYASWSHPYYSVAKSFFALGALVPVALLLASGFAMIDEFVSARARALRPFLYGWVGMLVATVFLAYRLPG